MFRELAPEHAKGLCDEPAVGRGLHRNHSGSIHEARDFEGAVRQHTQLTHFHLNPGHTGGGPEATPNLSLTEWPAE